MTKGQEQVKEFMTVFGQETPDKPVQLSEAASYLRAKLILEEALETITKGLGLQVLIQYQGNQYAAVSKNDLEREGLFHFVKEAETDLVELADGLADLAYVAEFGTALAAGIDLEPIQDEVHASNMSKLWTKDNLEEGKAKYPDATVIPYKNLFILKRPDGKVYKSTSYRPANIAPILERQKNKTQTESESEDIYEECVDCPNCSCRTFLKEFDYCNSCGCGAEPK